MVVVVAVCVLLLLLLWVVVVCALVVVVVVVVVVVSGSGYTRPTEQLFTTLPLTGELARNNPAITTPQSSSGQGISWAKEYPTQRWSALGNKPLRILRIALFPCLEGATHGPSNRADCPNVLHATQRMQARRGSGALLHPPGGTASATQTR